MDAPEARWHADADGIGHAFLRPARTTRSLCNLPAWNERHDWPIRERCPSCTAELNGLTVTALRGRHGGAAGTDSATYRADLVDAGRGGLLR